LRWGDEAVLGELGAVIFGGTAVRRNENAKLAPATCTVPWRRPSAPHLPAATKRRPIRPPLGLSYAIWMLWFFSGRADALAREHRGRRHADRRLAGWLPPDGKRRAAFASASSAAVTEAYPLGHGQIGAIVIVADVIGQLRRRSIVADGADGMFERRPHPDDPAASAALATLGCFEDLRQAASWSGCCARARGSRPRPWC
jgi:hypothetical protein